jgi:hypothetical protein
MRTVRLVAALALTAAAFAAGAQPPTEQPGPFTYDAVGATPALTFGRKEAPKTAASAPRTAPRGDAGARAGGRASTFTYEAVGATPHVPLKPAERIEAVTKAPTR